MSRYDRSMTWKMTLGVILFFVVLLLFNGRAHALECRTFEGKLSAYQFNPWYGTVKWRQEHGQLPDDLSMYDAHVATDDCSTIGWTGMMHVYESDVMVDSLSVIVFDCMGADAVYNWMDELGFAVEMDYLTWMANPTWFNNPNITANVVVWEGVDE